MRTVLARRVVTGVGRGALLVGLAGCGGGGVGDDSGGPQIVVTTPILGDVVRQLVGDAADVEVVMPPNVDPHEFAASAQQAATMREADALVVNGLGFEESLEGTIAAAEADGVPVITATDAIDPLPFSGAEDHDADEDDTADEDATDHAEDGDDEDALDPHLFTDPVRMRAAAELIGEALAAQIPALDTPEVAARVGAYLAELDVLDVEVEATLAPIPAERRLLVTNHDVFGYFADRYGLEVLGAIIPGGSTLAAPSGAELAELATEIEEHDVPAIFADVSSPSRLADALAAEGTPVEVVELYSESLGEEGSPAATYIGMIRTNAERIAAALS